MLAVRNGLKTIAKPAAARVMSSNAGVHPIEKYTILNKKVIDELSEDLTLLDIMPTPWDKMYKSPRPEGVTIYNDRRFVPANATMEKYYNPDRFHIDTRDIEPRLKDTITSRNHPDGNWNLRNIFGYPINGARSEKHSKAHLLSGREPSAH